MASHIRFSLATKKWVEKIGKAQLNDFEIPAFQNDELSLSKFLAWLQKPISYQGEHRFYLEALQTSLLVDLENTLKEKTPETQNKVTGWAWLKFIFFALMGAISLSGEAFDGIANFLGLFPIHPLAIVIISLTVALFYVSLFFSMQFAEMATELGVSGLNNAKKLIIFHDQQVTSMLNILHHIDDVDAQNLSKLDDYLAISAALQKKYDLIDPLRFELEKKSNSAFLKAAKLFSALITGLIIYGGCYLVGQYSAMFIAGFFIASVSSAAWPVVLASLLVGLCAFGIYWYSQRPGLEDGIARIFGFDPEILHNLCDKDKVVNDKNQFIHVEKKLAGFKALRDRLDQLESCDHHDKTPEDNPNNNGGKLATPKEPNNLTTHISGSFFPPHPKRLGITPDALASKPARPS